MAFSWQPDAQGNALDVRKRSPGLNRNCPPSVRFPPLYEVGRNDPVFFQLEIDGRAFEAEQGFRAVRAADLAARPLKDIAQIALLKFGDRGKIRDDEGPRPRSGSGRSAG